MIGSVSIALGGLLVLEALILQSSRSRIGHTTSFMQILVVASVPCDHRDRTPTIDNDVLFVHMSHDLVRHKCLRSEPAEAVSSCHPETDTKS